MAHNPDFLMEIMEVKEELDQASSSKEISRIEEKNKGTRLKPLQKLLLAFSVCSDKGLTLETSAKHHIPQVTNILYQPC